MMSLTERLVGEGTSQDTDYKEELVDNALAIAQSTIVSVAKKVEDNVLCMMTTPVFVPQPTVLQNPAANLPCALLKAPNALSTKQICLPLGKLKATKQRPKLTKAQAQQLHQPHLPISVAPW